MNTRLVLQPIRLPVGIRGAIPIKADCGHLVWVSPSGVARLEAGSVDTMCLDCLPDGALDITMAPGGMEELAAHVGAAVAAETFAMVRAFGKLR